ncbi:hypothetical protein KA005_67330 [bacterium]|nr:hypothetical protein [bacterium]
MKELLLGQLIKTLVTMLTPELMKTFADMVLDFVEEYVKGTKSKLDDRIVLPLCDVIRRAYDIPDND